MTDLHLTLCSDPITLLPERALFHPPTGTLFVADTHWGKAATFRAFALPLPEGSTAADLIRLSAALSRTGAQRLVILGDLLHAALGRSEAVMAEVGAWRAAHAQLEILLVRGNHDRGAGDPPPEWGITAVDSPHLQAPFVWQHKPQPSDNGYVLAGHLHPLVQLTGKGRQTVKLPCFWVGEKVTVLPAFTSLASGALIEPTPVTGYVLSPGRR